MNQPIPIRCLVTERLRIMGRSQGWLSQATGDSREYVNRICQSRRIPRVNKALAYAKALNCTIEELWRPVVAKGAR